MQEWALNTQGINMRAKKIIYKGENIAPPETMNIIIALSSMSMLGFILYYASHTSNVFALIICAITFLILQILYLHSCMKPLTLFFTLTKQ